MMMLTANNRYTVDELASRLETSPRTIYRYIDTFKEAGFLITKAGDCFRIDKKSKYFKDISQLVHFTEEEAYRAASSALEKGRQMKDKIDYNALMLDEYQRYVRKHEIELYRKFTLAVACLIFFFIGAPLGAITRKGGLGTPVVISVVMFLIYYIIDNTGYKMAREVVWPSWAGMWLSSFVLLPIGIFLTYKAAKDSALFNSDAWMKFFKLIIRPFKLLIRKIRKIIIRKKKQLI
jgi:lipopolysaccharide export system permease protein